MQRLHTIARPKIWTNGNETVKLERSSGDYAFLALPNKVDILDNHGQAHWQKQSTLIPLGNGRY